jgi:HSP20 family molecular chaperone IbpA
MADISRRESERGTIQPRRGRGLESLWDWEPFRSLMPGNLMNMYGIDVTRTEDGYDVEIPVPGFRPDDIDITYQDGLITVSGRSERRSFTRSLSVPEDVDEESIDAHVEHGILMLHLKQLPERQPRRISIRGATQRPPSTSTPSGTTPSSTTQTSR